MFFTFLFHLFVITFWRLVRVLAVPTLDSLIIGKLLNIPSCAVAVVLFLFIAPFGHLLIINNIYKGKLRLAFRF